MARTFYGGYEGQGGATTTEILLANRLSSAKNQLTNLRSFLEVFLSPEDIDVIADPAALSIHDAEHKTRDLAAIAAYIGEQLAVRDIGLITENWSSEFVGANANTGI